MGVDFNRIDLGISSGSSRNGFGTIVSNPSTSGGSFPPYGTLIQTLSNYTYPIAEGGSSFVDPNNGMINIPNQKCTVDELANGTGGVFLDWTNERDIAFISSGVVFYVADEWVDNVGGLTVSVNGVDYPSERGKPDYRHDGYGGYASGLSNLGYKPYGSYITEVAGQTEVPSGSGNYYSNGIAYPYYHDGNGGAYSGTNGSYYSSGTDTGLTGLDTPLQLEVPTGSGSYYNTGQFSGYVWDGSGGVNSATKGTAYANGVFIRMIADGTFSNSVEVPSGSGNYYDSKFCGTVYRWDGSGGSINASECLFYPNATFIYNDGTNNYYWDGSGNYYT
ncbi:hypothetical protein UFOVP460_8 [uncultured Caudovirales phage]|uniref:Uncharacterized protein n=1 Tax=uncultured Caudovirales phage TaxID=2100421 RepID=A0A6J5MCK1_9CAUD|nr:hypothetical protein UFOVP460_8 [uncultured Caudovirales phage]